MIVLDTHIWVWWVQGDPRLTQRHREEINKSQKQGIGICSISCLEVARLVERGRLGLPDEVTKWLKKALSYPGIELLTLTPTIAVESVRLPGNFHKDPADRIIVASARTCDCPLVTVDEQILNYPFVKVIAP